MQDLSNLANKSLATDSMKAGNQVWDRSSMSAPGGNSGDLGDVGEEVLHDAPSIEEIPHTRTVLHPEAPPMVGSPYPRFAVGGPREWKKAGDQLPTQGLAPAGGWDDDHKADVPPEKEYGGSSNHG